MHRFKAKILIVGVNPYVDVPNDVSAAFGRRGYVPVTVSIRRGHVRTTLVPMGGGKHRLYMNAIMRELASAGVGDTVALAVALDSKPRTQPMPSPLRLELAKRPEASRVWGRLAPSRRFEILRYLNFAKRRETLERNVAKVIAMLEPSRAPGALAGIKIPAKTARDVAGPETKPAANCDGAGRKSPRRRKQ